MALDFVAILNNMPAAVDKLNEALGHVETIEQHAVDEVNKVSPEFTSAVEGIRAGLESAVPMLNALSPIAQMVMSMVEHIMAPKPVPVKPAPKPAGAQ